MLGLLLTLQSEGSKRWRVYAPATDEDTLPRCVLSCVCNAASSPYRRLLYIQPLPARALVCFLVWCVFVVVCCCRESSANLNESELPREGVPDVDAVLEPGDFLYFPRGFIHQVF